MPMDKKSGLGGVKGLYSSKPKEYAARRVESSYGPGKNADQMKANKLLHKAHMKNESLRGKGVM